MRPGASCKALVMRNDRNSRLLAQGGGCGSNAGQKGGGARLTVARVEVDHV